MIKRTLYFGNPVEIHLQQQQLLLQFRENPENNRTIPIEDIGLVIIDHQRIQVSHGVINALISNNAAILWCDAQHLPNGLIMPYTTNHIFQEKIRSQLEASEPLKKQLWKQTVQAKINNQAALLKSEGMNIDNMRYWSSQVGSGDPENYEGRAASYYWKMLFSRSGEPIAAEPEPSYGKNVERAFIRHRNGEPPNNLLNYGYAVLRAIVARSLVASGCLPALGIHHRNKYNHFCLADDIMEPYRPFVDSVVLEILRDEELAFDGELTREVKQRLLQIPVLDVVIDKVTSPLMVAMQRTTASLMKCYEGGLRKIVYPEIRECV